MVRKAEMAAITIGAKHYRYLYAGAGLKGRQSLAELYDATLNLTLENLS
jgi:hypothetical protein